MRNRRTATIMAVSMALAVFLRTGSAMAGDGFQTLAGIPVQTLAQSEMETIQGKVGVDLGLLALLGLVNLSAVTNNSILSQTDGGLGLLGLPLLNLSLGADANG